MIWRLAQLRTSVRGRLLFLVVAIALPAAVLVAALTYQAYRNQREAVSDQLLATSRAIAATVDTRIAENLALLKGLGTSRVLAQGNIPAFRQAIDSLNLGPGSWIVLADTDGQQLINPQLSGDAPLPRNPYVEEHERAIAEGNSYISNIITGRVGRFVMFTSIPVPVSGAWKYTLTYVTEPSAFTESLQATRLSSGLIVGILDRNGTIAARIPRGAVTVGGKAVPDLVAAVERRFEGMLESHTLEGEHVLVALGRAPQSGWTVAIGSSYSDLFAPARRVGCLVEAGRARLWIRDNGIGIKPELQGRLFQMFERVHTERGYGGTGIGLAIVRKALERMNGTVRVESDGGSGTTFWVELAAS